MDDRIYTVGELKKFIDKLPDDTSIFTYAANFETEAYETVQGIDYQLFSTAIYLGE